PAAPRSTGGFGPGSSASASPIWRRARRARFRAAKRSARVSRAPLCSIPSCCCSTSPSPRSTPQPAKRCLPICARSSKARRSPPCSSPTTATVLPTHAPGKPFPVGGGGGVLKDGELLQLGPRDEVFFHPQSEAVAEI